VQIDDNGPGFTEPASAAAFAVPITSGAGRQGRGLLEVNDAVRRIGGTPSIVENDNRRCVQLVLPRAGNGGGQ
jgi:sensor histidine kinase regulating citrate/malate metabolism